MSALSATRNSRGQIAEGNGAKGGAGKGLHARQTAAPLLYHENSIPHFVF
jgi:hypothetical protein